MAGRVELVKSVLASQAIYHLTPLAIPPDTLKQINKFIKTVEVFWLIGVDASIIENS
jgi:hypothetical protein